MHDRRVNYEGRREITESNTALTSSAGVKSSTPASSPAMPVSRSARKRDLRAGGVSATAARGRRTVFAAVRWRRTSQCTHPQRLQRRRRSFACVGDVRLQGAPCTSWAGCFGRGMDTCRGRRARAACANAPPRTLTARWALRRALIFTTAPSSAPCSARRSRTALRAAPAFIIATSPGRPRRRRSRAVRQRQPGGSALPHHRCHACRPVVVPAG